MSHYFAKKPTSPSNESTITKIIDNRSFTFQTDSGVFSASKIDLGGKLLATSSKVLENQSVLDLGCAYGVVGIVVKRRVPSCTLTMVDINSRAVQLAIRNAKANNVEAVTTQSDGFEKIKDKKFDVILFNPPFSAGKKIWEPLIEESKNHLKENGSLQVVCRYSKGGKTVEKILQNSFDSVEVLDRKSGFRVFIAQ